MRKKVLLSLDDELVERIDAAAAKAGQSRSAWLAEQAMTALGGPVPTRHERSAAAIREIQEILAAAPPIFGPHLPAAMEVRRMRDERTAKLMRLTDPDYLAVR